MTFVDELLVIGCRTVSLVDGEIIVGVISPGIVAVELADREQLDCVHTEALYIRNLSDGGTHGAVAEALPFSSRKITEKHLIYHEVSLGGTFEIICLPFVGAEIVIEDSHRARSTLSDRKFRHVGID